MTERSFIAEVERPEPLRFYLYHEPIHQSSFGALDWLGWSFIVRKISPAGEEIMFRDHWEETFLEILRYSEKYSDGPPPWRCESSGELVDLGQLQPRFDMSRREESAVKTVVNPDATQRLCFNLYDDGKYRYTLEELLCEGRRTAWVPRDWSPEHVDLGRAEKAAQRNYTWFVR